MCDKIMKTKGGINMYFNSAETKVTNMAEGVVIRVASYGGPLMATEVSFEPGAQAPMHSHPHEQLSYIAKGSCEFTVGNQTKLIKTGDGVYIPGNVSHSVKAVDETVIVDIFTPQREDFK
jgi:quercetin dioxygenase-like cupin family protein